MSSVPGDTDAPIEQRCQEVFVAVTTLVASSDVVVLQPTRRPVVRDADYKRSTMSIEETAEALNALAGRRVMGKLVLRP